MSSSEVKQLKGQVYKSTGSRYHVKDEEGTIWDARIKGKMKIDSAITSTTRYGCRNIGSIGVARSLVGHNDLGNLPAGHDGVANSPCCIASAITDSDCDVGRVGVTRS
jgi:hypothetical protein